MKKATLEAIRDTLLDLGVNDTDPMVVELTAELNKGAEEKAARAAAYASIHDVVVDNLTDTPVSLNDLWPEIEADIATKGMTKHNVQYALNNLWQDEIEKISGKPNTYRRK
jgi:UDP-N-acetylmuramyl tripeptide synthase